MVNTSLVISDPMSCPPGDPINFSFEYGFIFSNNIEFHIDPGPPPLALYWSYGVSNTTDRLWINGTLGLVQQNCADVPSQISHSNVVAVLMPTATIRVSEVEVCWNAASNRTYQVQYRSALGTNDWTNLGVPRSGNGSIDCITDKTPPGQPQRFYRVLIVL